MKNFFSKFQKKQNEDQIQLDQAADETKSAFMERILGKEHNMVMHAIIPYAVGGTLDLYYYPNLPGGTAIATKELVDHKFNRPSNNYFDAYELVMCVRHPISFDQYDVVNNVGNTVKGTFNREHAEVNAILNVIARYSSEAKLNPYETIEFPENFDVIGGKCMILDCFSEPYIDAKTNFKKFGLMLLMEIHRAEMEYAMQQKGKELLQLLKEKGIYPFTGIDRDLVI